jgi:hypothetical protein
LSQVFLKWYEAVGLGPDFFYEEASGIQERKKEKIIVPLSFLFLWQWLGKHTLGHSSSGISAMATRA